MRYRARQLAIVTVVAFAVTGCAVHGPFVPTIEASANWQLSEGCRIYQYGIPTDSDCDILTGQGIVIQITKIHALDLPPGQDNRATVGIEFEPNNGNWHFSSPYVSLELGGSKSVAAEIDQALVLKKRGRSILPEKLERDRQQYELPTDEQRFFRVRFAIPQTELSNGFALRVTGLERDGAAVPVPVVRFN